jgi:endogenous inhibitor of DNA gyrase (YacG/DUF329 family)
MFAETLLSAENMTRVKCPKCSLRVLKEGLQNHQGSSTCGNEPWQQFYRMPKSTKHKCPCDHCKKRVTLSASTIWKHLKYVEKYWTDMKKRMNKRDRKNDDEQDL